MKCTRLLQINFKIGTYLINYFGQCYNNTLNVALKYCNCINQRYCCVSPCVVLLLRRAQFDEINNALFLASGKAATTIGAPANTYIDNKSNFQG